MNGDMVVTKKVLNIHFNTMQLPTNREAEQITLIEPTHFSAFYKSTPSLRAGKKLSQHTIYSMTERNKIKYITLKAKND